MTIHDLKSPLIAAMLSIAVVFLTILANAEGGGAKIGIVIMHGKGGSPAKHVSELASTLERQGYLVANLEMPWSGRRDYDVDVGSAENEVESALRLLRDKGAQKVFVAGHSQGGLFALHFGGKHVVDGVIAIAPGGNVASPLFREKLGESVEQARKLVAEGKGGEKARLSDFEPSKGTYLVFATPAAYLTWFDPDGAMNMKTARQHVNPATPVLYIVPTDDYPGALKLKQQAFDTLPKNPLTRMVEPNSNHLYAPSASIREIIDWTTGIAGRHE